MPPPRGQAPAHAVTLPVPAAYGEGKGPIWHGPSHMARPLPQRLLATTGHPLLQRRKPCDAPQQCAYIWLYPLLLLRNSRSPKYPWLTSCISQQRGPQGQRRRRRQHRCCPRQVRVVPVYVREEVADQAEHLRPGQVHNAGRRPGSGGSGPGARKEWGQGSSSAAASAGCGRNLVKAAASPPLDAPPPPWHMKHATPSPDHAP